MNEVKFLPYWNIRLGLCILASKGINTSRCFGWHSTIWTSQQLIDFISCQSLYLSNKMSMYRKTVVWCYTILPLYNISLRAVIIFKQWLHQKNISMWTNCKFMYLLPFTTDMPPHIKNCIINLCGSNKEAITRLTKAVLYSLLCLVV